MSENAEIWLKYTATHLHGQRKKFIHLSNNRKFTGTLTAMVINLTIDILGLECANGNKNYWGHSLITSHSFVVLIRRIRGRE